MAEPQSTPRITKFNDGSVEISNLDRHSRMRVYSTKDVPMFVMVIKSEKSEPLLHALVQSTGKAQGVFKILLNDIQKGTYTEVTFERMASILHTTEAAIYPHLRHLKDIGLVRKVGKDKYLMNPHLLWKGHSSERHEAIRQWDSHKKV